ncbi:Activated CDC42 kinase 1 [Taenia solium]|eukprot:TsM_000531200 transcript=TsM_000531200 gene=TsM_000531200
MLLKLGSSDGKIEMLAVLGAGGIDFPPSHYHDSVTKIKPNFCVMVQSMADAWCDELVKAIRPSEVIAMQDFDEADRMDVVAGDRILVIEGRAENFWWRGQNRRTGEIAFFPREIVRLQRHLQCQDISRPIENSFVHVGHHGFEGRAWGHVDRVDP